MYVYCFASNVTVIFSITRSLQSLTFNKFIDVCADTQAWERDLKGLCHQIRKACKWYSFKGLDMDMRRMIFKNF
jgi:hypothetical protein